jgi:hypothetical protein
MTVKILGSKPFNELVDENISKFNRLARKGLKKACWFWFSECKKARFIFLQIPCEFSKTFFDQKC